MPLVAVVTPYYNAEKFLSAYCTSLISQTFKDFSVYIFDDNSSDFGCSFIKQTLRKNKIETFIEKSNRNVGPGEGRECLINRILTKDFKYVAFLDADDRWDGNKLEVQLDIMKKNLSNFSATLSNRPTKLSGRCYYNITLDSLFTQREVCLSSVIISTDLLKVVKSKYGYLFRGRHAEDYRLWINAFQLMKAPIILNQKYTLYVSHDRQISKHKIIQAINVFKLYREICEKKTELILYFTKYVINKIFSA